MKSKFEVATQEGDIQILNYLMKETESMVTYSLILFKEEQKCVISFEINRMNEIGLSNDVPDQFKDI